MNSSQLCVLNRFVDVGNYIYDRFAYLGLKQVFLQSVYLSPKTILIYAVKEIKAINVLCPRKMQTVSYEGYIRKIECHDPLALLYVTIICDPTEKRMEGVSKAKLTNYQVQFT